MMGAKGKHELIIHALPPLCPCELQIPNNPMVKIVENPNLQMYRYMGTIIKRGPI